MSDCPATAVAATAVYSPIQSDLAAPACVAAMHDLAFRVWHNRRRYTGAGNDSTEAVSNGSDLCWQRSSEHDTRKCSHSIYTKVTRLVRDSSDGTNTRRNEP
jgi:hypothetical protein